MSRSLSNLNLVSISRDPFHPLHEKIKLAHIYANKRRIEVGIPLYPWPLTPKGVIEWLRLVWFSNSENEVMEARTQFDRLISEGYEVFVVDDNGDPLNSLIEVVFDASCEEFLFKKPESSGVEVKWL